MTTVIINDKSKAARLMIEYLKTQSYAKIVEEEQLNYGLQDTIKESEQYEKMREKEPNAQTKRAIHDVQQGKVTYCDNVEDMLNKLKA